MGDKGPFLPPPLLPSCVLHLLKSSSVLLVPAQQVSCKYTELDHVSTETLLSFWESEMHKLFCSVFASDVLSLET